MDSVQRFYFDEETRLFDSCNVATLGSLEDDRKYWLLVFEKIHSGMVCRFFGKSEMLS